MSCTLRRFRAVFVALAVASALAGCRHLSPWDPEIALAPAEAVGAVGHRGWGETIVVAAEHVIDEDGDGPYVLDSGDRLRIFVYGLPTIRHVVRGSVRYPIPNGIVGMFRLLS